ncbi:APC family permease [Stygiobacter electus]|uniref:Amino acid permease n=1 Tax=Stygiobacter electus TaxID=3032292 RepID=A0AAE3P150_9BACT|nr:amino acid permease [Stygiobacter electus]MDF1612464.1 amino acid permease [Stygiobacter electus]
MKKKNFLSYIHNGKWLLTWLAVGIFTLMDELTSIYYAPFEAFRFIGLKAIIYIGLTSILIRFLSTRMVEIGEILEVNNIRGGGVYSFSYLVLGPTFSFLAIASILVDYILTATISTVSAIENGTYFLGMSEEIKFFLKFGVIGFITILNIIGVKENAKFTFLIFVFASFVLSNLIVGGSLNLNSNSLAIIGNGFNEFSSDFSHGNILLSYENLIIGIGSCILAYSGIESVLQTASLIKNWHDIRKSYLFLAFTVGIITPLIALFALSSGIDLSKHETDLIPTFSSLVNGKYFGIVVGILASITLIMAVNTAMVASAELIEKVAERYNFHWLIVANKKQSLYKIHILNALLYSTILIITSGSQAVLAEMYAVGLVASFTINTGSLLKYRYSKGTKEITYHTSRLGTLFLFFVLFSTLIYIMIARPYGTMLWFIITSFVILAGLKIAKSRAPEIPKRRATNTVMDIIFKLMEIESKEVHIFFRRPLEKDITQENNNSIYISFYSPRVDSPTQTQSNYFQIAMVDRLTLIQMISGLLETIQYEIPKDEKEIHLHFGWPLSSWFDRLSIGIMIHNIMRLPNKFPDFNFHIEYFKKKSAV